LRIRARQQPKKFTAEALRRREKLFMLGSPTAKIKTNLCASAVNKIFKEKNHVRQF